MFATIFGISGLFPKHTILLSNASVSEQEGISFFKGLSLSLFFFHLKQVLETTYWKITFMVTNIQKLRAVERLQKVKEEKRNTTIYKIQVCRGNKEHESA